MSIVPTNRISSGRSDRRFRQLTTSATTANHTVTTPESVFSMYGYERE